MGGTLNYDKYPLFLASGVSFPQQVGCCRSRFITITVDEHGRLRILTLTTQFRATDPKNIIYPEQIHLNLPDDKPSRQGLGSTLSPVTKVDSIGAYVGYLQSFEGRST